MSDNTTLVQDIDLSLIDAGILESRFHNDDPQIAELAASMDELGQLQPILVSRNGERYRIIAGRRRVAAARMLGWETIRAQIIEASEEKQAYATFVENFHRLGLNPLEEAVALAQMLEQWHVSQTELAERLAVDRTWLNHRLSLLNLEPELQEAIMQDGLSPSIACELARVSDPEQRMMYLNLVRDHGANLRVVRQWVRGWLDYHAAAEPPSVTPPKAQQVTPPPPPPAPACIVCGQTPPSVQLLNVYLCWNCKRALEEAARGEEGQG